ncbi:tyrosine-type recombinase/integrase [Paenactinomyces guangxiensis]|uniref:Tyrosine-type recombinase/integrase n=1 Tax=Paenactinomyces guangxiensis TaxID=1490290 RepID=A0A7W1WUN7_9BACL|nr:tyrosine-type recombinase/integrase [Paenactinomyces guangxiensis]MBA4496181.1 tyrosine-type recombinase/integrase [Paenactinomyces guangxiensis]MBH8593270.1 tyrosine-type recombinase/integrase [Paenactinomyces guangxiensis]
MLIKFAIRDFIDEKIFNNLSEKTIHNYELTLKSFQGFCSEREIIDVGEVTTQTIKSFLVYLVKERGNKPGSVNHKLKHLRVFFNYLLENDLVKNNPTEKIKRSKEETRIEVFTDKHIRQMLGYYRRLKQRDKSYYAYRDHTLIILLLGTGMRIGEVANLKWSDVDLINQTLTLFGKARKQQTLPITEKLVKELSEYRIFCERNFDELPKYVFATREGEQMGANALKKVFKRLKSIMNFKDVRLSAHTFRHTFAHRFLMNGGDVFTLQKLLRHSQLRMTERYLALWGTALKDNNEKFNPLNNLYT